jgi:membrane-associated phospholipid phosphatase
MLLAALAIGFVDQPVARWVHEHDQSALWEHVMSLLEYPAGIKPWSYTIPAILVGGVLATLAVERWRGYTRAWMYVAIVYLLTRNLMAWGKWLTGRYRPYQWIPVAGDTFGHANGASFPSGHVVVFAGLLLPLAVVSVRTRPLLLLIPFVMMARVAVLAHFVSDVLAGLALTALVAWACMPLIAPLATAEPARP